MHTRTKATNYELTPDIAAYLDERLAAVEKLLPSSSYVVCDVELSKETAHAHGDVWRAEVSLEVDGSLHRAVAQKESMQAAIDEAKDELANMLRREKTKHESLLRKGKTKLKELLKFGRAE
jgi:ribosomal subunit interface protein